MLEKYSASADTLRTPKWYGTATRWTQLTLVEDDPLLFDPDFWIDIFKRTKSNATCLSAGGYIAYYPSKVPYHYVSRHLGGTDPFGRLVDGARALDMHVMARVDPHAVHDDAASAHPEWIAVDRDGNKRRHWAFPEVWVTCAYGDYNQLFMPEIIREIVRDYDVDAIFANRWQGHGICYCEACHRRFRDATGFALPPSIDASNPVSQAWVRWRRELLSRLIVEWDEEVKAIKPHASFIPNMGGASLMEFDPALIERHCPFLCVDDQGRHGTEPVWMAGRNGKRMRATFPERPAVLITSIGPEEVYRWKDAITTAPEIRAWVNNGTAHGMLAWFTKFNGKVPDDRWVAPIAKSFDLQARVESSLVATTPQAEIAILDPATTLRHWGPEMRKEVEADDLGFYHALVEARLPFELLSDQAMTAESLDRFKVVVLANSSCLSDAQCAMLEAYVARGGNLVAAFETATRDEAGRQRPRLGLGDLLGAELRGPSDGPVKNSYVAFSGEHPIRDGFDGAQRIMGGTRRLPVTAGAGTDIPLLHVPDFPDLPMEEVYVRDEPRDPAMILRSHAGGGRTVYLPWNIGGIFWEVQAQDHGRLIANSVLWALGDRPQLEIIGRSMLDVGFRASPDMLVVTMFNLTNPMMMKGPMREVYPVGPQTLSVALPPGCTASKATLLVAGRTVEGRPVDGRLVIEVDGIEELEVMRIDLDRL
ncbi:family 10 glycosylhydrolase [Mesorhizobium sp. BR1-1-16]|uniref:alpha-amylase family protein n=1 Tax=Mesorhizobium sp. BR1-1-16 TaxID=2876653 RepID=UPI001CC95C6F|nr:alpha-amylase family protein [Mesorhizobium sp. BR1-1-16]MBZ9938598.1 family 10 glycosylhydrolase [Mesorhizobium sp. BR1-1-16]